MTTWLPIHPNPSRLPTPTPTLFYSSLAFMTCTLLFSFPSCHLSLPSIPRIRSFLSLFPLSLPHSLFLLSLNPHPFPFLPPPFLFLISSSLSSSPIRPLPLSFSLFFSPFLPSLSPSLLLWNIYQPVTNPFLNYSHCVLPLLVYILTSLFVLLACFDRKGIYLAGKIREKRKRMGSGRRKKRSEEEKAKNM